MSDRGSFAQTGSAQERVVVERTYPAAAEPLWELWTTKEGFESWWGPEGFRVDVHALEACAGGVLRYDMIADAPEAIAAMKHMGQPISHMTNGRFGAFEPHDRLSLIHIIDFVAGVAPYEVSIEVEFQPLGDLTRMVVTLEPHPDPHWTKMSTLGFQSQIGKLDRRFGGGN
ncbi:SRPBCC family protein [Methylobacterium brachythecii]|uniref:Uncharacterized protein YndB with AHSA1/START domain n=1 Tax=Methylobacterium brachythecii TaxID=1176177 RepID=A0A7W6F6D1_9HYPH|nr:SRPBCC domain-containing protein [Methylobacterium brachythecii]MBB3902272.1 uncharacterized protein YndB with AHSA1/START domain [Methylobacterium brachythecii]GLS42119.1 hypothetical protein GCM10007884_01040 [Methylobacterium brachythecii]